MLERRTRPILIHHAKKVLGFSELRIVQAHILSNANIAEREDVFSESKGIEGESKGTVRIGAYQKTANRAVGSVPFAGNLVVECKSGPIRAREHWLREREPGSVGCKVATEEPSCLSEQVFRQDWFILGLK
jgi:hypothetical protein